MLPWWASVALAVASFVLMYVIASQDPGRVTSTREVGAFAARNLFMSLASIGQYILPLIFIAGAVTSAARGRNRQKLIEWTSKSDSAATLDDMTWQQFEELVHEAFRIQGYSVRRVGGEGPDGGVDLILDRGAERVLVQCKRWRAFKVGVNVVRELYGVMAAKSAAAGIVVTSGRFTPDAVAFASGRNVRLIDGQELFKMIREIRAVQPRFAGLERKRRPESSGSTPGCPRCGKPMVRREAKRGANVGKSFWGCSGYPTCRGIVVID